ncbi:MAG: type II CAAX endopeptidase family protein, partial [Pseudomonadota bacterium]
ARAAFFGAARDGRGGLWRAMAGMIAIFVAMSATAIAVFLIGLGLETAGLIARGAVSGGGAPALLLVSVVSLAAAIPAAATVARVLHGRAPDGMLGAARRLRPGALAIGALGAAALGGIGLALAVALDLASFSMIARPPFWWALSLALFLLIPLQAGAEELVFRGYLAQEIGARAPLYLVWAGFTSALFALAHMGGDPDRAPAYMTEVFAFGLFAAALVYWTGGISAATGFHTANNWVALLIFEPDVGVEGVGYVKISVDDAALWPLTLLSVALFALAAPVMRAALAPERPAPGAEGGP